MAKSIISVIDALDLQGHVLDAKSLAQHAPQIVQHLLGRAAVRAHVAGHRVEAARELDELAHSGQERLEREARTAADHVSGRVEHDRG